jgi:hypothetical protein
VAKKTPEERIREIAREVSDAAAAYIEKAQPVVEDVKSKAQPYVEDIISKAEPVIDMVKEKATPVAMKASKVAQNAKENITRQAARLACNEEVFIQYSDHEIRTTDLVERAKADFYSRGNKPGDIDQIQIYIKPADNAAYYVVNHKETGRIEF